MEKRKTALVLGATGGIGGAVASALAAHGWHLVGLTRSAQKARTGSRTPENRMEWIEGDAMNRDDVIRAGRNVEAIIHAVNPPGYRNWDKTVLPMIDNTIAAARAAGGARVVLPGTIYNFDPAVTPVAASDTLQTPRSRKGAIRVAMERRLENAAPEVPSLILRAGDFFGPEARANWFSQAMVKPGRPVARIVNPGKGTGHSWAYLPDLAEAFARLMDEDARLARFERLQFEGLWDPDGTTMIQAIRRVVGRDVPERRFPWWLMHALTPFGGFAREAAEIAQYWRHPLRLDHTRLVDLIGAEPRTPLETALRRTLSSMGALDEDKESPIGQTA